MRHDLALDPCDQLLSCWSESNRSLLTCNGTETTPCAHMDASSYACTVRSHASARLCL